MRHHQNITHSMLRELGRSGAMHSIAQLWQVGMLGAQESVAWTNWIDKNLKSEQPISKR